MTTKTIVKSYRENLLGRTGKEIVSATEYY